MGTIKNLQADAFERLCQRLLREAGFIQVEITGRSGDGGIDGRGVVKLHRFLHDKLGHTTDLPVRMTGAEEALPKLCELLNNLQDEIERAGHRPGFFSYTARYIRRQAR